MDRKLKALIAWRAELDPKTRTRLAGALRALIDRAERLITKIEVPVENAPPPDVGGDKMRAQIAVLDDGLDIPERLRRVP
jgi:hypothetical protein